MTTHEAWKTREAATNRFYAEIDQYGIQVWTQVTSYGRIYGIVDDLQKAEKALQGIRQQVVNAQREITQKHGLTFRNMGEVYADTRNSGGNDRMVV